MKLFLANCKCCVAQVFQCSKWENSENNENNEKDRIVILSVGVMAFRNQKQISFSKKSN